MTVVKSPCILDISHWNRPDWPNLDGRVRGVIPKATQGRYYVDPTFGSSWIGARSRPRSAYHFFEANDVPAQVANFLTACEDVGAIVGGKWKGEIEPVLDAEYQPSTSLSLLGKALGIKSRPKVRKFAALDLEAPEKYLIVNPRMRLAHAESIPANRSVTGPQLAAQYKQWLDLVEAELGVKPIIYTSKWMWDYTGNPAWSKEYKLWVAQYPLNPDGQNAPAYLPSAWDFWWLWQYTSEGALQGVAGEWDLTVFNGSEQEWDYFYGGGYGQPPEPPIGETDMGISIGTVLAIELNVRNAPNGTIIGAAFLHKGDLVQFDRLDGVWAHLKAARRAGKDLTLPGAECWASMGATGGLIRGEWTIEAAPATDAAVSLTLGAANVDGVLYLPYPETVTYTKA